VYQHCACTSRSVMRTLINFSICFQIWGGGVTSAFFGYITLTPVSVSLGPDQGLRGPRVFAQWRNEGLGHHDGLGQRIFSGAAGSRNVNRHLRKNRKMWFKFAQCNTKSKIAQCDPKSKIQNPKSPNVIENRPILIQNRPVWSKIAQCNPKSPNEI
jgi:hypothetical protein